MKVIGVCLICISAAYLIALVGSIAIRQISMKKKLESLEGELGVALDYLRRNDSRIDFIWETSRRMNPPGPFDMEEALRIQQEQRRARELLQNQVGQTLRGPAERIFSTRVEGQEGWSMAESVPGTYQFSWERPSPPPPPPTPGLMD